MILSSSRTAASSSCNPLPLLSLLLPSFQLNFPLLNVSLKAKANAKTFTTLSSSSHSLSPSEVLLRNRVKKEKWIAETFGGGDEMVVQSLKIPPSILRSSSNDDDLSLVKNLNEFLATHQYSVEERLKVCFKRVKMNKEYLEDVKEFVTKATLSREAIVLLLQCDSFNARFRELKPYLKKLIEKLGRKDTVRLMTSNTFCCRIEVLLPSHLDKLIAKFGQEAAIRLFCNDSFALRYEEIMPHYPELRRFMQKENAYRLLTSHSFCSRFEYLLPYLKEFSEMGFTRREISLLFSFNSFCSHFKTILPMLPWLMETFGREGTVKLFTNSEIFTSMTVKQWTAFMKFVHIANQEDAQSYCHNKALARICKSVGWEVVEKFYQANPKERSLELFRNSIKRIASRKSFVPDLEELQST